MAGVKVGVTVAWEESQQEGIFHIEVIVARFRVGNGEALDSLQLVITSDGGVLPITFQAATSL